MEGLVVGRILPLEWDADCLIDPRVGGGRVLKLMERMERLEKRVLIAFAAIKSSMSGTGGGERRAVTRAACSSWEVRQEAGRSFVSVVLK